MLLALAVALCIAARQFEAVVDACRGLEVKRDDAA